MAWNSGYNFLAVIQFRSSYVGTLIRKLLCHFHECGHETNHLISFMDSGDEAIFDLID